MARDAPLFALGLTWSIVVLAVSIFLPAMPDPDNKPRRVGKAAHSVRGTLALALLVSAGLVVIGFVLWLSRPNDMGNAKSDLGAALLGAAVVPFAIFLLEHRFNSISERREALEAERREASNSRNHAQIITATLQDLPGIDLSGRDLNGFYLRKKNLSQGNLQGCDLTRAQLEETNLAGAQLQRAVLVSAYMVGTHLEGALLTDADLTGSNLKGAFLTDSTLTGANLSGALLAGADLTRAVLAAADLRGAQLREANNASDWKLPDCRYDEDTTWPLPPFDATQTGAVLVAWDDPWKSDAELKSWEAVAE